MARAVGMPISVGMTVSIPYARAKEVLPVGRPGVVQYAHKTLGNSSTYLPLACSSLFFNADNKVLLVASTCPLLWEYQAMEYKFLILSSKQKVLKATLSN